jgi:hypothetical protein
MSEASVNLTNFGVIPDTVGSNPPSDVSSSHVTAYDESQWNVPSSSTKDVSSEVYWSSTYLAQMLAAKEEIENEVRLFANKSVGNTDTERNLQGTKKKKRKSVTTKVGQHTKTEIPRNLPAKSDRDTKKEDLQIVKAKADKDTKIEKALNLSGDKDRDKKEGEAQIVESKTDRNARSVKTSNAQSKIEQDPNKGGSFNLEKKKCKICRNFERKAKNKKSESQPEERRVPERTTVTAEFFLKELTEACQMLGSLCNDTISEYPNFTATFLWFARRSPFHSKFYLRMAEFSFLLTVSLSQLRSALTVMLDTVHSIKVMDIDPEYLTATLMELAYTITLLQFNYREMYSKFMLRASPDDILRNEQSGQTTNCEQPGSKSRITAILQQLDEAGEQLNVVFQKINTVPPLDQIPAPSKRDLQGNDAKERFFLISTNISTLGSRFLSLIAVMRFQIRKN